MQTRDYQDSNPKIPVTDVMDRFRFHLLQALMERLTDQGVEVYDAEELSASIERVGEENGHGNTRQGKGQTRLIYRQAETLDDDKAEFSLQAQVTTQDGREQEVDVDILLPHALLQISAVELRAGHAHLAEPLQLSFNGPNQALNDDGFFFDIELADAARGTPRHEVEGLDELYAIEDGYDYESLDEEDELYLDDDEEVYGRLRVWTKDERDHEYLFALGEVGAEAIFLGHVQDSLQMVTEREVVTGQLSGDDYYLDDDDTDLYAGYDLSA